MKEFILMFRASYDDMALVGEDETQARMSEWMQWVNGLVARGILAGAHHLDNDGRVVTAGGDVANGTCKYGQTSVLGFLIVKAADYDAAVSLAKDCPVLKGAGNSVEVRMLANM